MKITQLKDATPDTPTYSITDFTITDLIIWLQEDFLFKFPTQMIIYLDDTNGRFGAGFDNIEHKRLWSYGFISAKNLIFKRIELIVK